MQKFLKRRALVSLILAAMSVPAFAAGDEDNRGEFAMVGDILVARPMGVVLTAAGAVLFVVSLPFTAIAGGVDEAADALVVGPATRDVRALPGMPDVGSLCGPERRQPLSARQLFGPFFARSTRNASATIGSTNLETLPPSEAISRTSVDEMNEQLFDGNKKHVLDRRFEFRVHLRHLKLVLEVRHRAQSAQDEARAGLVCVVDQQPREAFDLDARPERREHLLAQTDPVERIDPSPSSAPTFQSRG